MTATIHDLAAYREDRLKKRPCAECGHDFDPDMLDEPEDTDYAGGPVCWDCADKIEVNYLEVSR